MKTLKKIKNTAILILLVAVFSCSNPTAKKVKTPSKGDLQDILASGKIKVLMENSSVSYFNYKDKNLGFEYEMIKSFCEDLGVELEVQLINNYDDINSKLEKFDVDLVACNYTVNSESNKTILFSEPYIRTDLVLVQRGIEKDEDLNAVEKKLEKKEKLANPVLIKDPIQLAGKHISVRKNSNQMLRLQNLIQEIGDTIYIDEEETNNSTEDLMELVSKGKIEYTIAERNLSDANKNFYTNLESEVSLGIKQNIAFGMRTSNVLLKTRIDTWLKKFMTQPAFAYIKKKYFLKTEIPDTVPIALPFKLSKGALSNYDGFFKDAAKKHTFDWRLLAAVSFKESRFQSNARGYGGSYGLMQFMPGTGPSFGVYEDSSPEVQINGGMSYLARIYKMWKSIPDVTQRQKFMLGSYNAGPGHIQDAKRLAEKHNLDPLIWDGNVEEMVIKLSQSEYYKDEVVKCGSMRGQHTANYVSSIMSNYNIYKSKYK